MRIQASSQYSYTTNTLTSSSTIHELCVKYNKCSENLQFYKDCISVKIIIIIIIPASQVSWGGAGNNVLKYIGIQGSNFSLQTLVSLNFTEVFICIRALWFRPATTRATQTNFIISWKYIKEDGRVSEYKVLWQAHVMVSRSVLISTVFRLLADGEQEKSYWFCPPWISKDLINVLCKWSLKDSFKSLPCPHLLNTYGSNFLQDVFPSRKLIS